MGISDLGALQRAYDNRAHEYEPELPQIDICERAVDMIHSASRLYNQTMPKLAEADGTVEDAIMLLLQIPGITLPADVKARWECWMRGRVT